MKRKKIKIKKLIGVTLIVIGVIGLFVEIIEYVLLIIVGLLLLGIRKEQFMEWFNNLKTSLKRKV